MCSLKRPFDDQTQARIAVETGAVLAILHAVEDGRLTAIRSTAHELENLRNPDLRRARAVAAWMDGLNPLQQASAAIKGRAGQLMEKGLRLMDAFHLAWAEHLGADVLITVDDQFLSRGRTVEDTMVRVIDPITLIEELKL
jgi:predicted nucleic acid-binding protein